MKKNFKLFLCLVAVFIVSVGINVNAYDEYQWESRMDIIVPIHKTDESGKGLDGAIFSLKDFNNTVSFSSSDEKNGDYLIQKYSEDQNTLDKIINMLPSEYKEVITGIKSWDDIQNLQNRKDMEVDYGDSLTYIYFYIPLKVEETVAPEGYQQQDYVVTGSLEFEFQRMEMENREDVEARSEYYDDFYDNGMYIHAYLTVYEWPNWVSGYFEYDSSKDYAAIYKEINKKFLANYDNNYSSYEEYIAAINKIFEDEGYNTKDVKCSDIKLPILDGISNDPVMLTRENFEDVQFLVEESASAPYCYSGGSAKRGADFRFDDEIEECYCVIQVKDKKKTITVNPQTASTIGIISLITLGSIGFITAKKLRKNN